MRNALLSVLTLAAPALFAATARLPQTVIPSHYAISISPDLASETFAGEETIDVDVKQPVDSITLHGVDLTLHDVRVTAGDKRLTATSSADAANEMEILKLDGSLPAGHATIHIGFDGKLTQRLQGLYLSKTARRKYAVTQFEATSARRAFPCFDEPAMKATFDIALVIDAGDSAISNGTIVSDTPAASGKHKVQFSTTKKMSTYLVAMLVGDFQCISGSADGVPIRVCATPGLQNLGHFALEAAEASISYFDRYYGIHYVFDKLDLIGIPDFAAGAMENAGAITFRETDLLVDEKNASILAEKRVAEVVAHEIAHQWFGDLVTMKWWNDLWLNEGFATFMSEKPIAEWKPEWRTDLDKPMQTDEAFVVDSQRSTHPIRSDDAGFDAGITYGKTASVLRMVEQWLGPDVFRDGIRTYLRKYSYSNAAAEDFWGTLKDSSKQPVDAVMQSFIDRTGTPLLHVTDDCTGDHERLMISQERMLPRWDETPRAETWTIPICAHTVGSKLYEPCRLIGQPVVAGDAERPTVSFKPADTVPTNADCKSTLFLSRGGSGYFLLDYSAPERAALRKGLGELTPPERISYHGNEWLLTRNGQLPAAEYLELLRAMPRPAERQVVTTIADNLVFLHDRLVNDQNREAFQRFVHEALRGLAPATWDTPAGETAEQRISRAYVLWTLAYAAGDKAVIAGARQVADQYMKDPSSVDALIADRALRVSAVYGDQAFFDRVVEQLAKAPNPEIANRYRSVIPLFRDPAVIPHAIDYIYGDQVRSQDLPLVASSMFLDPATRPAAWEGAKAHWADVEKRAPNALGRISNATSNFCDAGMKKEVEAFLKEHPSRFNQRGAARALESIDSCIAFKAAQQTSFDEGLKK